MADFYSIREFAGIQQQKDGSLLPEGTARDARNCCTWDGNLSVAKGYVHHIASAIPGTDKVLKLIPVRGASERFYAVTAGGVYASKQGAWIRLHTFDPALTSAQIDYEQMLIGSVPCLIVATGQTRMLKIVLATDTVEEFGDGLFAYEGAVLHWNAETLSITLSSALSDEAVRHISLDGVTIAGKLYKPEELTSFSGDTIVLAAAPETAPVVDDTVTVRGGGSDAQCNFIGKFYGRLIAAGDPLAPCRLYWSAVVGDGRTVEDWLAVEGSADASGGYVEVGNESDDPIVGLCALPSMVLIFKRFSEWRLYGDRPSNYTLECVEPHAESVSNASAVIKYGMPYFLTMSGLKTYGEVGVVDAFGGTRYLKEFLPLLHSTASTKGVHCDNRMYFSCKVNADATYDDAIIELDFATGAIMIRDGFEVADMAAHDGRMFIIDGNRYVCEFNKGSDYAGTPIAAYWQTQPTDLGMKCYMKQITNLYMRCTAGNMDITLYIDDATRRVPRQTFDKKSGYVNVVYNADLARVFSIRFENIAGSQFCIKGGVDVQFNKEKR